MVLPEGPNCIVFMEAGSAENSAILAFTAFTSAEVVPDVFAAEEG